MTTSLHFSIISTFPETMRPYTDASMLGRAQEKKLITVSYFNPRDFATDKHHKTDDIPYGGGPGMVMKAEPILRAVAAATKKRQGKKTKVIVFSPQGKQFTNAYAQTLSKKYNHVVLIAGRYEGIDARVKKILRAEEVSVGPYVLTGGEVPALIVVDSVARQLPGVLGKSESLEETRTAARDVYTRPETLPWKGKRYAVPKVLRSGDHAEIDKWRKKTRKG
ncbi:MAG: tRNA (guanine-N(1)-)-methyltransferase [Candidatus Campbellbacteria bacterium]